MTREEAISELQPCVDTWNKWMLPGSPSLDRYKEAVKMALTALRGPTREQVRNLQGEWLFPIFVGQKEANDPRCQCSECGSVETPLARHRFCPSCGAPMTDDAVDIVMERLEALKNETAAN